MSIKSLIKSKKTEASDVKAKNEEKDEIDNVTLDEAINAVLNEGYYYGSGIYYGYDGLSGVWFI